MLIEDFLMEYENELKEQKRSRIQSKAERKYLGAMIASFVIAVLAMIYFQFYEESYHVLVTLGVFVAVMFFIIWKLQKNDEKNWDSRLTEYQNWLEKLNVMIQSRGYTDAHISKIIEWCEEYASSEGFWVKTFQPIGVFVSVCIIPIVTKCLESLYSSDQVEKRYAVLLSLMVGALFISIFYGIIPTLRDMANRRHKLAGAMKKDLKMLEFYRLSKVIRPSIQEAQ